MAAVAGPVETFVATFRRQYDGSLGVDLTTTQPLSLLRGEVMTGVRRLQRVQWMSFPRRQQIHLALAQQMALWPYAPRGNFLSPSRDASS